MTKKRDMRKERKGLAGWKPDSIIVDLVVLRVV